MKKNKKALCCLCSVLLAVGICLPNVPAIAAQGQTQTQTATAQNQTKTTYKSGATLNNSITATDAGTDDGTYTSSFHSVKGSVDINGDENQKPTVPDTPDQPETPQKPETPTQPETPKTPEQPTKPDEPEQPTTPEEPQKVVVTPPTHEQVEKKITQETQSNQPKQAKSGTIETNEEPAKQEQAQEPNAIPQTGDAVSISGTIILLLTVACAALIVASVIRNERK